MKKIISITFLCGLAGMSFSQNFGIDQPIPTEKLDVNGNIKASGSITAAAVYAPGLTLQTKFNAFTATTSTATTYTYVDAAGTDISITAKRTGSIFKITVNAEGYHAGSSNCASNIGIKYVGTNTIILGVNGTSGDTWMGAGNSSISSQSWNITKIAFHNPGTVAGNTYTYRALLGLWSNGTAWINYPGYNGSSIITVEEIAQ